MKLDISKFQLGGGLGKTFSATVLGGNQTTTGTPTNATGEDEKEGSSILPKETLNKLRTLEYGLPNELDKFELELAELEYRLNMGEPPNPTELAQIRAKASRLIAQAGHLKKAEDHASLKNALDDIAIDQKGYIYAATAKGIEKVKFSEYNLSLHLALTYGELIEHRRQNPALIDNEDVISSINRATGIEAVNTFIYDILSKVKNSETKLGAIESLRSITGRYNANLMSLMEYLALKDVAKIADVVGLDTMFETSLLSSNSNMLAAYNYIMDILPQNMRALLEAHYLVQGGKYSDLKKHVGEVIASAAQSATESKDHYEAKYATGLNSDLRSGGGKQPEPKTRPITNLEKMANGSNQMAVEFIVPSATDMKLRIEGGGITTLYDWEDKMVGPTSALEAYNRGFRGLSTGNIYFGNQQIDEGQLNQFLYDGQAVIKASIPVNADGAPNFRILNTLSNVYKEFDKHPDWTLQLKNEYLKKNNIEGHLDVNGNFIGDGLDTEDFFIISAYTTKKEANWNLEVVDGNDMVHILEKGTPEHTRLMARLQSTIAAINEPKSKNDDKFDLDMRAWLPDANNPLVSAPLFIHCAANVGARASEMVQKNAEINKEYYPESIVKDQKQDVMQNTSGLLYL